MNNLKVYSHVRSGTHFLMSILFENFYKNKIEPIKQTQFGHWSNKHIAGNNFHNLSDKNNDISWGKLFGRHNFSPITDDNIIYIYRDGRDVLISMYEFEKSLKKNFKLSFFEYLNSKLDWYEAPSQFKGPKYTPIEHWYFSTNKWINSSVYKVRYEDLNLNTLDEIKRISDHFNLKMPDDIYLGNKKVGFYPRKSERNREDYFDKKSLNLFYSIVSSDYRCLHER